MLTHAVDLRRADGGGGRFIFGADCRPCDELVEAARDTDLLFVEATLPRPERTGIRGHLTPAEAGEHARRAGAKRVVLTHISDELDAEWAREQGARGVRRRRSRSRAPATCSRSEPRRSPTSLRARMARQRDLLVNFERMWREMDELLGDPFAEQRPRPARAASGFSPRVDVYYCGDEPRGDRQGRAAPASTSTRSASRSPAASW